MDNINSSDSNNLNGHSIVDETKPVEEKNINMNVNLNSNYVYAGFWSRFFALMIDGVIICIPSLILGLLFPYVGGVLLGLIYRPLFEASPLMATPGKAFMGIAVVHETEHRRLNYKEAYIRYLVAIVSGIIMFIGYLMQLFTKKRQTLHDMVAGVVVVKQIPPDVEYFKVWFAELKFFANSLWNGSNINSNPEENKNNSPDSKHSLKLLEDLFQLKQSGAITEEEYQVKKTEILSKIN